MTLKPLILATKEGTDASFGEKTIILKTTAQSTNGSFSLMEYSLPPLGKGSGFHIHKQFEKSLYILEGTLAVRIEDTITEVTKGTFVMIPREIPHDFYNPSQDTAVHFLMLFTPAGFEGLFVEMNNITTKKSGTPEAIQEIRSRYDVVDIPLKS